ncbi:3'-5' exonuclease [Streptococcus oralis]|uniref:DNA polymerase III subunit epsilon n=1 Tax=Streptococcus oralis subsp. oralis TaxID=1891914 RepID=A0A0F2DKT6_STROR|nr:3'-5' exonuclease [Streptococcus oralis]KEQ46472.1 exonuclease family protein [Streptococcus oralis]KJQ67436.1 DNA polymerase III subunit epsilon [Streptococcus oralis subsp. oralis]KJQ70854.1 DNA polymerase III subunit epsilon [Streptococcus oralis subsp. oralis]MBZ2076900.1 3'-5' exonuclease [Streptococcus oralis]
MEKLRDYIAFDLEFNQHEGVTHLIQVSAVRFQDGQECAAFDSYVYTTAPLKSFINGLTGITAETLKDAPKVEQVLKNFQAFVGDLPIVGYNAAKSDLPILLEHGIDYRDQYKVDLYEEAFERRSSDLHGIANLKLQTVANFLGFHGKSHNSLEDARMTARVYETFLESDEGKLLIEDQSSFSMNNPFGGLDLSQFLD